MNLISKIFRKISNNFFKGILISAPIIITFYIAWGLIKFFDKKASPLLGTFPYEIPGFGLITVFIFFCNNRGHNNRVTWKNIFDFF